MTLKEFRKLYESSLIGNYPPSEISGIWNWVITEIGISKTDFLLNKLIDDESQKKLNAILNRLKKNEPVQYIFNKAYFLDNSFYVNENVLIPRVETEELVNLISKKNHSKTEIRAIDIGTGSGVIPISLKKNHPSWDIHAIDISKKALEVAKKNNQSLETNVNFHLIDILHFEEYLFANTFDIIVSNPPYVTKKEKGDMHTNVLDYEPHLALFVEDNNPLVFYKRILDFSSHYLNKNGCIFFEINPLFNQELISIARGYKFSEIRIYNDMNKKPRFLYCKK